MKTCLPGDARLFRLLEQRPFDPVRAGEILDGITDINAPVLRPDGVSTTWLYEAQQ